ncbi:MAG: hypothetical protein MUF72_21885 [Elainella sp. Prado103]|jgi:hypothetical protein|nr:hypothetical protein [Elainella sp. Prado103]
MDSITSTLLIFNLSYDPALADLLDWSFVFGFMGLTLLVTWQIFSRSNPK